MQADVKRLFFGAEIHAPWPNHLPKGRLLDEKHRHLTLAFLGNVSYQPLNKILDEFPHITIKIGVAGYFDACLALPPHHPHVMAWHARWLSDQTPIVSLQAILTEWLMAHGYSLDQRPWKPHVTLCRQPFDAHAWMKDFTPLPFYIGGIHLYESIGNLNYVPLWSYPLKAPFEEMNHTADMAFIVRGENLQHIYLHAFTALAFKVPDLIEFFMPIASLENLDDVIIALNHRITQLDSIRGSPLKAVSFHGELIPVENSLLQWEMIVDV